MNNNSKKDLIDKFIFPISIVCIIADFIGLLVNFTKLLEGNRYINVVFLFFWIITLVCMIYLFSKINRYKSDLFLYESLVEDRTSLFLAIKLILSTRIQVNKTRVETIGLFVKIINIPMGDLNDSDRYDMEYNWSLKGINSTKEPLDKIYFRLAGDNSINLENLNFSVINCGNPNLLSCKKDLRFYCDKEECGNFKLYVDEQEAIKKKNFFLLPVHFSSPINPNDKFNIKAKYEWPKSYNSIVDYLLIDPYNFSMDSNRLNIEILIDGKIITEQNNVRLYSLVRESNKKREIRDEGTLLIKDIPGAKVWKLDDFNLDIKKIYFVELTKTTL